MKKKKTGRRVLSFLLTLAMVVGLMPGMIMTAYAAEATALTAEMTTWKNGDYVVPAGGLTIASHITVNGTVNLTLTKGATLTANMGITLSDGATLNVSGTGTMAVNGSNGNANSTVAGTGTLVLKSGMLTAKGGNGQGIEDRQWEQTGANGGTAINGSVIMNGGTLTATGGNGGSVGGSCYKCKGGNGDAAISGNLTVNGGTMTATNGTAGSLGSRPINSSAGAAGASIGGTLTLGKNVTLYDGLYNVLDDNNSSSREYNDDRTQIMHAVYEVTYAVTQITHTPAAAEGTVSMTYGDSSTLLPGETSLDDVKGKTVTLNITPGSGYRVKSVTVEKPAEATITLDNTTTGWRDGTYAVPAGGLTYSDAITVSGDVTLVLTDGETLTLNKGIGIAEGATLTIQGEGAMNINGTNSSTASTVAGCTGTLVLTGGTLTAKGGDGQGFSSSGDNRNGAVGGVAINGNVIIEGGTLTATGGNGGSMGSDAGPDNRGGNGGVAISGSLTINGGTVTTTNGSNGTNNTQSWEHSSAGSGGKAVAGTVTDNTGNNTETGGAGNESNPEETAAIIEAEKQTDGSWQFTMPDYSVTLNIKYEEGADKTALNGAITAAKKLYDSIKDNDDYTDIVNTLKTAINNAKAVADSDEADQDAVDAAVTALDKAQKEANDTKVVVDEIKALPESTALTTENYDTYKDAINKADTDFNELSTVAKGNVPEALKSKLAALKEAIEKEEADTTAAKAVSDKIAALPAKEAVTKDNKEAIEAAKAAYDALTDDQKKKVSEEDKQKLNDAVAAIKAIEKDEVDTKAAKAVGETINALPASDKVAITDKAAVEAARKAYDSLTADQKKKVSADTLKKLENAEKALETLVVADKATKELAAAKQAAQAAMNSEVKVTVKGKKIKVQWTKTTSADGYDVYVQYCGKKITKPVKTIKKNSTTKATIKKINGKKLNLKKQFRVYVVAYKMIDGKKVTLAKSNTGHVVGTKNKKYTNVKSIKLKKKAYTIAVGKTVKVKAKIKLVDKNKKHIPKSHGAKFRYRTSDSSIATVSKSGKIKGIKKGTCTIYVYAINGKMKKVKVTVK